MGNLGAKKEPQPKPRQEKLTANSPFTPTKQNIYQPAHLLAKQNFDKTLFCGFLDAVNAAGEDAL
ncbi:hypothetical protein [Aeromonas rivipollensis]|uniref:hypothetical protein n=1 Tax=Aeromonas rivipollensis TaxID=948519 RepID=UPI0013313FD8|nr:hypothetical protein [Aeromonas rivipollensis]